MEHPYVLFVGFHVFCSNKLPSCETGLLDCAPELPSEDSNNITTHPTRFCSVWLVKKSREDVRTPNNTLYLMCRRAAVRLYLLLALTVPSLQRLQGVVSGCTGDPIPTAV